ncbi:hypothetical protein BH11MYX2_BH11MYX2_21790 [soil metagenome]
MRSLLLIPFVALIPMHASADCGSINGLTPTVLTPDKAPLVGGGGILIADLPAAMTAPGKAPPPAPVWSLRDGTTKNSTIAPGLTVRVPTGKAKSSPFELVDATQRHVVTVYGTEDLGGPVPVPNVSSVVTMGATSYRTSGEISLKAPGVPAGIAAIVLANADGTPREFMRVQKGDTKADPIHGHCQQDPDGTLTTQVGDSVTLFYVDDHGRVSKPTKAFKVMPPPTTVHDLVKPKP